MNLNKTIPIIIFMFFFQDSFCQIERGEIRIEEPTPTNIYSNVENHYKQLLEKADFYFQKNNWLKAITGYKEIASSGFFDESIKAKLEYCEQKIQIVNMVKKVFPSFYEFREGMGRIQEDGKFGFVDSTGKVLIAPKFQMAHEFKEGFAVVMENNGCGYIDKIGQQVISTIYSHCDDFNIGRAIVSLNNGQKWGVINKKEEVEVPFDYRYLRVLDDNLLVANKNNNEGIIDFRNNNIIDFKYQRIKKISKSVIQCLLMDEEKYFLRDGMEITNQFYATISSFINGICVIRINGKYGIMNEELEILFLKDPTLIEYIEILKNGTICYHKNQKTGIINSAGDFLTDAIYDFINPLHGDPNLLEVKIDGKIGIIKPNGEILISPINIKAISKINDQLYTVYQDDKMGLINHFGKIVLSIEYDQIGIISEEYLSVNKEGKLGAFSLEGTFILPLNYDRIELFDNNFFWVVEQDKNYLFTKKGRIVKPSNVSDIQRLNNQYSIVKIDGYWNIKKENVVFESNLLIDDIKYLNKNLFGIKIKEAWYLTDERYNKISNTSFTNIIFQQDGFITVKIGDKTGLVDNKGVEIIPAIYEWLGKYSKGLIQARFNKKYGVINLQNEVVIDFLYDELKEFESGLAGFTKNVDSYTSKSGFVGLDGNEIISGLSFSDRFSKQYSVVEKSGYKYVIDRNGKCILNCFD